MKFRPTNCPKIESKCSGQSSPGHSCLLWGILVWVAVFFQKLQHRTVYPCSMDGPKYTKFTYFLTPTPLFKKYTHRCFADLCTKVILMPATEKYFPGSKIDYFKLVKLIPSLSFTNCRKTTKLLLDILAIKSYLGSPMQVAVYRHLQDIQAGLHSAGFSSCPNTRQEGYSSLY